MVLVPVLGDVSVAVLVLGDVLIAVIGNVSVLGEVLVQSQALVGTLSAPREADLGVEEARLWEL